MLGQSEFSKCLRRISKNSNDPSDPLPILFYFIFCSICQQILKGVGMYLHNAHQLC